MENIVFPQIKAEILDEQEPIIDPFFEVPPPIFEASFIETENKTLKYKCPMCNKKFKSKEKVQRHVNSHITVHSIYANGDFKCSECNSYFDTQENFQSHIETHKKSRGRPRKGSVSSDDDIKPYICDKCAKGFKRKQQLLIHSLVHNDIKPFQCYQCEKSFKLKQQLQNHSKVHEDIRPFTCDNCEKSFKFKQQLENHSKTHTDIRPFPCVFCGKAFKFKQQLQNHYRVHDDLRLFKCDFCDKAFKLKQQLQFHNKVHSDERPFQCFTCEKAFKFKQQLNKHYTVHGKIFIESSIFEPNINLETMDINNSGLNSEEKEKSDVETNLDNGSLKTNTDLNVEKPLKEDNLLNVDAKTNLDNNSLKTNDIIVEKSLQKDVLNFEGKINKDNLIPPPLNFEEEINKDNLIPPPKTTTRIVKKRNFKKHLKKNKSSVEKKINDALISNGEPTEQNVENEELAKEINSETDNYYVKQRTELLKTNLEENCKSNFEKQINIDTSINASTDHRVVEQHENITMDVEEAK